MDGPVKPAPADISDGGSPPPAKRCGACNKPLENDRRDYCDDCCKRDAAYTRERLLRGTKTPRKRQLRAGIREGVRNGPKNPTETITCKRPPSVDLGAFVRQQILAQQDQPNPIHFTTPDGVRGKVWLASKRNKNGSYSKIVGDERHWRVHIPEAAKVDEDARRALAAKAPLADIWQTELQPGDHPACAVGCASRPKRSFKFSAAAGASSPANYAARMSFCTTTATPRS